MKLWQFTQRLIKSLNPCVMVVIDSEANTNTPIFMDRFNEALFLYGAFFDYFDVCMERDKSLPIDI